MTAADRLIEALARAGCSPMQLGNGWKARCPAHEDRKPSLSIRQIEGQALVYCFASCETSAVMEAVGLAMKDLFDSGRGVDYRYDNGRIVHRSVNKEFPQQHTENPPELYRLSKVIAAVNACVTVYIVEGEKDVHALESIGAVATTSPMGAGNWNKLADVSPLAGAHVIVVPDQDDEGAKYLQAVLASLDGLAASVKVAKPRVGKDAADHVAAGYDLNDLSPQDVQPGAVDPPIPLSSRGALPPFPVEALPAPIAAMVAAVADFTQTDPGMAGTSALTMLSACAGGRIEVQVRPGWNEPCNLYTVTVAGPGERKSAVQATMSRPLLDAEKELNGQGLSGRLEAQIAKDVAQKAVEQAKGVAGRAEGKGERERFLADAIGAAVFADAIDVPALTRLIADDVTPEAAATLLVEQDGHLAILSAEGGIFDIIAGRYSGNVPNLDIWLKGHSGDSLRVDRKGREPEYVRRPALTLGLMIQPAVLEAIARNNAFRGRGLLARFLYAIPPSMVGARKVGRPPVPEQVAKQWNTLVRNLAITLAGWHDDPAIVVLDADAALYALDIETHIESQLGPAGQLGHIADWGAKLVGAIMRIACLLHIAEDPSEAWRHPIAVATLKRAVIIAGYYRSHALAAFDAMQADPVVADAEYLLDVIRRIGKKSISTRDLHVASSRSRFPKVGDLEPALAILEFHGHLAAGPTPESRVGRRPSPVWLVNPHVLATENTQTTESTA